MSNLDNIDPQSNLQTAIQYLKQAVEICNRLNLEKDLPSTWTNLGNTYVDLAKIGVDEKSNFNEAIRCYDNATEICKRLNLDTEISLILTNLGNAYLNLAEIGVDLESNQKKAINCHLFSFKHILSEIKTERNRQKVIDCYTEVYQFFKPNVLPIDCRRTEGDLGNLAFKKEWWKIAIEGYELAIIVVEQTRTWATTDNKRREILEDAIGIYHNAIKCYIHLGNIRAAITLAERSRARYLVDLMATKNLDYHDKISSEESEYQEKQREIDQLRQTQRNDNFDNSTFQEQLTKLLQEKKVLWQKLRSIDPILASQKEVTPLLFEDLKSLVDSPKIALISFYSTDESTYIFILRKDNIILHTCFNEGYSNLQNWIRDQWLLGYNQSLENWRKQIPKNLTKLSKRLQLQTLVEEYLNGIEELILIPHIFLHLIPFAALPIDPIMTDSKLFGDRFRLRYSFSGQILHFCQQREPIDSPYQHGIVEGKSDQVPLASWLGEQLTTMFNIPNEQRLQGIDDQASKDKYRQLLYNINTVTNYHHASSNLDNPLESSLNFADGSCLTLGELMSPSWRMLKLIEVFLCCCETNLGSPNITDDMITIAAGFLTAGARSVISTLWSVDQLATAIFCIYYYQYRQMTENRPKAIQFAQEKLRNVSVEQLVKEFEKYLVQTQTSKAEAKKIGDKSAQFRYLQQEQAIFAEIQLLEKYSKKYSRKFPPFKSPYYWAGFICQGLR